MTTADDRARAEDATYENEIALSRPGPVRIHVYTVHIDPPRLPFGGPFHPGDLGLPPPMTHALRESPAWCAHVDQIRQAYAQRYRMRP